MYRAANWLELGLTRGFRRAQGRRHRLPVVLALAAEASLCGMRGYKTMAEWASSLGPAALRLAAGKRALGAQSVRDPRLSGAR